MRRVIEPLDGLQNLAQQDDGKLKLPARVKWTFD
jgi:hypothetical protein